MEKTFAMIKPDALQRGLAGTIISRYEAKGLRIAAMKLM
ncbi:MAG: nucleoside-diphosphate kinase, partial [Peptococcaceae bacterium]|nr:nucleoside-diphosphate kinase [Peptococcaceae bacterium]